MELGLLGTRMQLTSPGNTWDHHSGWTGCLFTLLFFFSFLAATPTTYPTPSPTHRPPPPTAPRPVVSVSLGCLNKISWTVDETTDIISYNSGGVNVHDQDASTVGSWWKLSSWLTDSRVTESSHAGERVSFDLFKPIMGAPSYDLMEI